MFPDFYEHRLWLDHEFEQAHWDESSGKSPAELREGLDMLRRDNAGLSERMLRAKLLSYLMDNAQFELNPHNIFAEKMNGGATYDKQMATGSVLEGTIWRRRGEILAREMPEDEKKHQLAHSICVGMADVDYWHVGPNWKDILTLGFSGLLQRARDQRAEKERAGELTEYRREFYDSVILVYEAMIRYICRVRDAARAQGLDGFADCMAHLADNPPETLYQAMETSILFVQFQELGIERSRTLGLLDRLYYPFYQRDMESGRLTEEDVRTLFRYFMNRYSAAKRFAGQPLTIGGVNADGSDACNELTAIILEVYDELDIINPKIHVRWHPGFPKELFRKVIRMIRDGHSSMVIVNDETVLAGYERLGIDRAVASGYDPLGCYEPGIPGLEEPLICSGWMNIAKALELALFSGEDILTGQHFGPKTPDDFATFEEFYAAFMAHLSYIVEFTVESIEKQSQYSYLVNPSIIYSGTVATCMERGLDVYDGGMTYNNTSIKACCLATTVDSLMVLKSLVFERKEFTFPEFRDMLRSDWEGNEALRRRILNSRERFGNNLTTPDGFACDIYGKLAKWIVGRPNERGGVYRLGCDSVDHCKRYGGAMAATPDGRHARETCSTNLCAIDGMSREGATAYLESVLKLDHTQLVDSAVADVLLHPSAVEGEKGLNAMVALFLYYFKRGGFGIQGNVFQIEQLREAMEKPEKYKDLQVRVCGWNEYFVEMSPENQLMFLKRASAG